MSESTEKSKFSFVQVLLSCVVCGLTICGIFIGASKFYFTSIGNERWAPIEVQSTANLNEAKINALEQREDFIVENIKSSNESVMTVISLNQQVRAVEIENIERQISQILRTLETERRKK